VTAATLQITDEQGQAFWRAAQASHAVNDRYQFFVWLRLHLHRFIPHDLAMCAFRGASPGGDGDPVQLFYSVPLARVLLDELPQPRSRWWRELHERWCAQGGRAVVVALADCGPTAEALALRAEGFDAVAVHGIGARSGIAPETLFAFALRGLETVPDPETTAGYLDLWLPTLYCTAMRALAPVRADSPRAAAAAEPALPDGGPGPSVLTGRELQILAAVRDAKRNAQIGELLGISPLTVKNHLRKIMRKLNAGNRAQAVAEAMSRRLIA
jgi:DNA-binding CsgD family transcriptional regulator